ncbi:MAG: AAA family ATPase [Planctomycetota bacterium]
MKLAVSGKGGVGKTVLSALLARRLVQEGRRVLVVDADPDWNLAAALDVPSPDRIVPLVEMKELIAERMGTEPGQTGAYFRLNPKVDDLPARYCPEHDGLRLIVMGMKRAGGTGCSCPENAFLKALLDHLLLNTNEDLVVDMEAGLEHLGRATARSVDGLVVVVEPGLRSVETLERVRRLAADIGLDRCWPVANKVANEDDRAFLSEAVPGDGLVASLPLSRRVAAAGRGQGSLRQVEENVRQEVDALLERIQADLS